MSTSKQLQRKNTIASSSVVPTYSALRPSRSLASQPAPTSEQAQPVTQAQLDHAARFGHSLDRISILPPASHDTRERQADQTTAFDPASQVTQLPASQPSVQHSSEVKPTEEQSTVDHTSRFGYFFANLPLFSTIQRASVLPSPLQRESQLQSHIQASRSGGHPLDRKVQQRLEQGLGADLSGVRVHTDAEADHLSRSVNAEAFTTGPDIFFRSGEYHPGSSQGLHLLAHEATHVAQQMSGRVSGVPRTDGVSISDPGDHLEQAAEVKADQIAKGSTGDRGMTEGPVSPILSQHFSSKADSFDRREDKTLWSREVQDVQEPLVKAQEKGGHVQGNVLQRQIVLDPKSRTLKTIDDANKAIRGGLGKSKIAVTSDINQALDEIRNQLNALSDNFTDAFQILNWIFENAETVTQWLDNGHQYTWERTVYQALQQAETKKRAASSPVQQQQAKKFAQDNYRNHSLRYPDYGKPLTLAFCEQLLTKSNEVKPHLPTGQNTAATDAQTNATNRNKFTTVYTSLTEAAEDLLYYLQNKIGEPQLWEFEPMIKVNSIEVQLPKQRHGWASQPNGTAFPQTWNKIEIALDYRGGTLPDIRHFTPIQ